MKAIYARLLFASTICLVLALSCSLPVRLLPGGESGEEETNGEREEEEVGGTEETGDEKSTPNPIALLPINGGLNPNPPAKTVRLVFIHHSTGEGWLNDEGGGLGIALRDNRYYVSDTNYDWGPLDRALEGPIGSFTDIGHWWNWFLGPNREQHTAALFAEHRQASEYARRSDDPLVPNEIILFKSCFPNSGLSGKPGDAPTRGNNPLRGESAGSEHMTVANAKGIYVDLLPYFASHPEKLFVVITQPPLTRASTNTTQAANARAFASWLAEEWLRDYSHPNVAVFDFFTVLTSNGGRTTTNDLNSDKGNHHRLRNGVIEHITNQGSNYSAYGMSNDDSHPTPVGGKKATAEFIPLLNIFYHRWKGE
jgi:hypothetical protein